MRQLSALSELIRRWAYERNIVDGATQKDQFIKLNSEYGELCGHLEDLMDWECESNDDDAAFESIHAKLSDDIGDNFVVLTILAAQNGNIIEHITLPIVQDSVRPVLRLGQCYGKLGDAILKGDNEKVTVLIGQSLSWLQQIASELELELEGCIHNAYIDIKDRKGVMYRGAFIKSTDDRYLACCGEIGVTP